MTRLRKGPTIRCAFPAKRRVVEEPRPEPEEPVDPGPCPAARMLALAHHVERLVEAGEIGSYADASRALGLTRARMSQVMNLLLLAPEVQERVLLGDLRVTERALRGVVGEAEWGEQAFTGEALPSGVRQRRVEA